MTIILRTGNIKMNNAWWNRVFLLLAGKCSRFRVHCWDDEVGEISRIKQFGRLLTTSWKGGVVIEGPVSASFVDSMVSFNITVPCNGYNGMTPFFIVELDDTFSSTHYGTEVFIENPDPDTVKEIDEILSVLQSDIEVSKV